VGRVGAAEELAERLTRDTETEPFADLPEAVALAPQPANLSLVIPQA
jgi:hypothetical protein